MKREKLIKPAIGILWVMIVCALSVLCCLMLYKYDNKYGAVGPQAKDGVLYLKEDYVDKFPIIFLVDGWEYYSGKLLCPRDFVVSPPAPDKIVYIGQYSGFEQNGVDGSPHGSATYRLNIILPENPSEYMLELPEIYSAYRLYINGRQVAGMGEVSKESYRAETGNDTVRVIASGKLEILLAVSDYTHIYSGLVYPPAFGERESVSSLLNMRFLFRSLLAAFSLAIGIMAVFIGFLGGRSRVVVVFGVLCILFVGYTGYQLWQAFPGDHRFLYAVENASYYALLIFVILLQNILCEVDIRWKRVSYAVMCFGIITCVVCLVMPILLPMGKLWIVYSYPALVMTFQWVAATWLTISAINSVIRSVPYSVVIMCGILVFNTTLLMDRILPRHEPIITGWFPELGSFCLVLCIGISVGRDVAEKYHDNAVISERAAGMERLLEMQMANYEMLSEKIEETRHARHDLRHHFMMIGGFVQNYEYEKLMEYIKQSGAVVEESRALQYSNNDVVNVLLHHYVRITQKENIILDLQISLGNNIGVSESDLCAVLSNLLENAVEACRCIENGRFITLSMAQDALAVFIHMENNSNKKPIHRGYSIVSSKDSVHRGYGLKSIQSIAKRYRGEAEFVFDNNKGKFISTVLLMSNTDTNKK